METGKNKQVENSIVGILLAAGPSTRFGSHKLLHPIDTVPMGLISALAMAQALPHMRVVVHQNHHEFRALLLSRNIPMLVTKSAGMGESLALGVKSMSKAQGWVVGLADMPYIRPETYALVRDAIAMCASKSVSGANIAAPIFNGQRGHPVGFGRRHLAALMALQGNQGARDLLKTSQINFIHIDDPGVLFDIDTPKDLPSLEK